ncbi:MAG: hypothetical protein ABR899_10090 [Candidatus Krumholzibacteriaceae bacterium]
MKKEAPSPKGAPGFELLERLESAAPWRRALVLVAILVVLLCALMPEIVFQNKVFLVPDAQAPMNFAAVGEKALADGTYPLWNPYIFCGMPSYASLSFTPYVYPPAFVTYLFQHYLRFPELSWLLFHYLMAGVGVYLLARSLGARSSASMLAGMSFMLMPGYVAIGSYGHGSQACSIAYMPYALLLAWHIMRGQRRLAMSACLAIVLGFQMLRGHVQIAYYTYLLIGLLFIFESIFLLRARQTSAVVKNFAFLAAAAAVAVGIASVLLIPVQAYAAYSIRGGGGAGGLDYGYATNWSLHPKEMLTFIFPWAFGYGYPTYWGEMPFTNYPNYLGIVTVAFALFALFFLRSRAKWFLVVAAVCSTVLSFGKFFPLLYGPMFKLLPYFNKFRVPVMALIIQQLAVVTLMALGVEEFLRRREEGSLPGWLEPKRVRWILVGAAVLFVLVLVANGGIRDRIAGSAAVQSRVKGAAVDVAASSFVANLLLTVAIALSVVVVAFAAVSRRVLANTIVLVLALIAAVDLFAENRNILHPEKGWPGAGGIIAEKAAREEIRKSDEVTKFLGADSTRFRLFPAPAAQLGSWGVSSPLFSENRFMNFGISSLGGYHAAKLKDYQDVLDAMFASFNAGKYPAAIIDMLNAKYILSAFPLFREGSPFPLVLKSNDMYLYSNPLALPRAFCVDAFRVLSKRDALAALGAADFDPSREAILNEAPSIRPVSAAGASARVTKYGLNAISIAAHVEKPCILVVSEIAYPDWKAEVDGVATPILTADYCLRALALGPGDHEIRMRFSSRLLRVSLLVSIVSLAAAALVPAIQGIVAARGR